MEEKNQGGKDGKKFEEKMIKKQTQGGGKIKPRIKNNKT